MLCTIGELKVAITKAVKNEDLYMCQKLDHDAWFVIGQYVRQLKLMKLDKKKKTGKVAPGENEVANNPLKEGAIQ